LIGITFLLDDEKKKYKKKQCRPPSKKKKRGKNLSPSNRKACHSNSTALLFSLFPFVCPPFFPVRAHAVLFAIQFS
jgi:hypothetical protein